MVHVLLFLKLYIEYLQNCTKYLITMSPDITTLSSLTLDYLDKHLQYTEFIRNVLEDILAIDTRYSAEDLKIIVESWFIKICK